MSALDVLQAAQNLGFESPQGLQLLVYNVSEPVNVTWRTPYDFTTVELWQGPFGNGAYSTVLLVGKVAPTFFRDGDKLIVAQQMRRKPRTALCGTPHH